MHPRAEPRFASPNAGYCAPGREFSQLLGDRLRTERAISRFPEYWKQNAQPFAWTKNAREIRRSTQKDKLIPKRDTAGLQFSVRVHARVKVYWYGAAGPCAPTSHLRVSDGFIQNQQSSLLLGGLLIRCFDATPRKRKRDHRCGRATTSSMCDR